MGPLNHLSNSQNCIKSTNKIPPYAREYKKEYLFIIGLDKEFKYLADHINEAPTGLFESRKVDRIKYLIKRFLKAQEKGKLKDISDFEFDNNVVDNIIKIKKNFSNFEDYVNYCLNSYDEYDKPFICPYPGFYNIYYDFELFFSKLKIKYKKFNYYSDSDSDSDSDINVIYDFSDSDSDSDINVNYGFSDSDSDSF